MSAVRLPDGGRDARLARRLGSPALSVSSQRAVVVVVVVVVAVVVVRDCVYVARW